MSDDNTTQGGEFTAASSRRYESKDDPPKLKNNQIEEYDRWKRYIKCWTVSAKVAEERHGTRAMMHGALNEEANRLRR